MRDRALKIIAAFPWAQARTRTTVEDAAIWLLIVLVPRWVGPSTR
jgi:hypothetical protein